VDGGGVQVPDVSLRACLARLLGQTAARADLPRFTGQIWLTYPGKRGRLRAVALSGDLDPGSIRGQTFPDILGMLAAILTTEHGHVLCRAMLPPGMISGVAVVGYTMFLEPDARHLVKPQPLLVGVMVQLDGRELVLQHDPASGLAQVPAETATLETVLSNTWHICQALDNMSRAPLDDNAAELAQQIVDIAPRLVLQSGAEVKMAGSAGSIGKKAATAFVAQAARQAASERPPIPKATPTLRVVSDATAVAKAFTRPTVDTTQVVSRRFRHVD
jgi:hypothetical protein